MKISKILAGMSAAAIAGSMLSMVVASAEAKEQLITDVSVNVTVENGSARFYNQYLGWYGNTVTLNEGTADYTVNPNPDEDGAEGFTNLGYVQSTKDTTNDKGETVPDVLEDGIWVTVNTMTVNGYEFKIDGELDGGNNGLYNMWWGEPETEGAYDLVSTDGAATLKYSGSGITLVAEEQYNKSSDTITPFTAPDDAVFFVDQDWWSPDNLTGTMNGAELKGDWAGDGFQVVLGKEGYTVDTTDAKVVVVLQTETALDAEAVAFKYYDLDDNGDYVFKATGDEKDNIYTVELAWADFVKTIADVNGADWVGDDWGQAQFQFGAVADKGAKAWIYVTGVKYTAVEDSSSEESSEESSETDSSSVDSKKADSSSKAASTAASTNPGTGAAALAAVGVALAGAAVVSSKKRK